MVVTFSLSLPRDEASVPIVRHLCRSALNDFGVQSRCVADIELAVTEACTNVLKHAEGTNDIYDVTVGIDEHDCMIRVIDSGGGFDHHGVGREEALAGAESGRGIHLMRALVDNVRFTSRPEEGTVVHLEKELVLRDDSVLRRLSPTT